MADQSDVETVLATLIAGVLYPQGPAMPSVLGRVCRVYRGWPNQAALDVDLAAGRVNVTVFPEPGNERNTTRYPAEYQVTTPVVAELSITVAGETATVSGAAAPNQLAGLLADDVPVVYRTVAGDTPSLVAAILAAALRPTRVTILSGATVTVPGVARLIGRVVSDQPARMETRRQQQGFRLSFWCPDHATRDACASVVDAALAAQTFIALPDGTAGRLRFQASTVLDHGQDARLYRRDLVYTVEYATTLATSLPSMLFGDATIAPNGGAIVSDLYG
jgi:hypothetical protein